LDFTVSTAAKIEEDFAVVVFVAANLASAVAALVAFHSPPLTLEQDMGLFHTWNLQPSDCCQEMM
jgi:hypothetical protein